MSRFTNIMIAVNTTGLVIIAILLTVANYHRNFPQTPMTSLTPIQRQDAILKDYHRAMDICQKRDTSISSDFGCNMAERFRYQIQQLHFGYPELPSTGVEVSAPTASSETHSPFYLP
jgi:hypothetical protein